MRWGVGGKNISMTLWTSKVIENLRKRSRESEGYTKKKELKVKKKKENLLSYIFGYIRLPWRSSKNNREHDSLNKNNIY